MRTEAQIKAKLQQYQTELDRQKQKFSGVPDSQIVNPESIMDYLLSLRIQSFIDALEWVAGVDSQ